MCRRDPAWRCWPSSARPLGQIMGGRRRRWVSSVTATEQIGGQGTRPTQKSAPLITESQNEASEVKGPATATANPAGARRLRGGRSGVLALCPSCCCLCVWIYLHRPDAQPPPAVAQQVQGSLGGGGEDGAQGRQLAEVEQPCQAGGVWDQPAGADAGGMAALGAAAAAPAAATSAERRYANRLLGRPAIQTVQQD